MNSHIMARAQSSTHSFYQPSISIINEKGQLNLKKDLRETSIVSSDNDDEAKVKLMPKKSYAVTSDEERHKFVEVWNSGTRTIK